MLPTIIRTPPQLAEFTTLEEHQSSTPAVFFSGKPVLHFHGKGAVAAVSLSQCDGTLPFFPADLAAARCDDVGAGEEKVEKTVDVLVASSKIIIFSHETESGLEIPYPAIAIHAVQSLGAGDDTKPVVWMQLELWDSQGGDNEFGDPIELTLALPPTSVSSSAAAAATSDSDDANKPALTPRENIKTLYDAMTACAELHPDPADDSSEDDFDRIIFEGGGQRIKGLPGAYALGDGHHLPPPMPGSSGWITAENVGEFFDEDGNWLGRNGVDEYDGGEDGGNGGNSGNSEDGAKGDVADGARGELGEGAGHVRDRNEVKREEVKANGQENGVHGKEDANGIEAKKPRIQ